MATLNQRAIYSVIIEPGFFESHLERLRSLYRSQAAALVAALRARLGGLLSFREPEGGMFVWGRLTGDGADAETLFDLAVATGVAFVPGAAFAVVATFPRHLRLSFATATVDELDVAVARLSQACRRLDRSGSAAAGCGTG